MYPESTSAIAVRALRIIQIFFNILIFISIFGCAAEEIILHGDISGYVTDTEHRHLEGATVKLVASNDSTVTEYDGSYLLTNHEPDDYLVQATKFSYDTVTRITRVEPATNTKVDFVLSRLPSPEISVTQLDFGLNSTQLSFTISNAGIGKFDYHINTSEEWITVHPVTGDIANETDTITVTIDRSDLSGKKRQETIAIVTSVEIIGFVEKETRKEKVDVFANGIFDQDGQYYGTVKIGTQTWMAENLNTGKRLIIGNVGLEKLQFPDDNSVVEKYCYFDNEYNCDLYGGLYIWEEMMDYNRPDTGTIGSTQGICPSGWHIPTEKEWETLTNYLGGPLVAGGKLKAPGIFEEGTGLWLSPNTGGTNESGFSALPGGYSPGAGSSWIEERSIFRRAQWGWIQLEYNSTEVKTEYSVDLEMAASVRCIKDE